MLINTFKYSIFLIIFSYLSSSSSLTQVISRLLCVLEVFVGACIIRIVSVYEEISLFAWFYSLGEQANFDVCRC